MAKGRYSRIKSRFWNDEKVITWDDDTKLLSLYLMSSPHHNILGCYYLPMGYICEDLGWEVKRLRKPFHVLLNDGFIKYDEQTKVVLVINYLKNNPIENENQAKAAAKQVIELPKTELLQDVKRFVEQLGKPFMKRLVEQIPEPVTVTVTVPVTVTVTEKDPCANPITDESEQPQKLTKQRKAEMFNTFWQAYPNKKSKGQAEKTWDKLPLTEMLFTLIISKLQEARSSPNWTKEGGKYIPYPATWLNAKGWEDEYEVDIQGEDDETEEWLNSD